MIAADTHISERAAELRRTFDRSFAEVPHVETVTTEDFLAVHVGSDPYMLRLSGVAGLFVDKKVTRLPSRIAELSGVAGFRGVMVPVYDLAALLHYPASRSARWMVIAAEAQVAFAFETFDGHVRVPHEAIAPPADKEGRIHIREIIRTGDGVRPIIHLASVIAAIGRQIPGAASKKEQ